MRIKKLKANEIITLNDFPVHNEHILKIFFKIFKEGYSKIIPPCPVIDKNIVIPKFDKKLIEIFKKFEINHVKARYFLLDGSHKTTAASLTNNNINVMIFENNKDIQEAKELVKFGQLFSLTVGKTIKDNSEILNKHFLKKPYFQTVEEKTKKMIKEKVIPSYIIKYYKNLK